LDAVFHLAGLFESQLASVLTALKQMEIFDSAGRVPRPLHMVAQYLAITLPWFFSLIWPSTCSSAVRYFTP
ncbi:MAG: hypothetical protein FWG62_02295, partial [Proteobacteria bacterium]|nr:hypothetical protein [Pseudomonadota bacterium]